MRILAGMTFLLFLFTACSKDPGSSYALDGAYTGVYFQTGLASDTGAITLAFAGNGFSGQSVGTTRGICNGNYEVGGDSVNFINLCSSVPDSLLLLVGKYRMSSAGDSLFFTRNIEHFNLKKQ